MNLLRTLQKIFEKRAKIYRKIVDFAFSQEYSTPNSNWSESEMVSNPRQLGNKYSGSVPKKIEKSLIGEKVLSYAPYLSKSHLEELRYYWGYQKREEQLREKLGL